MSITVLALDPSAVGIVGVGLFRFSSIGLIAQKPVCLASCQIDIPRAPKGTFQTGKCAMAARADRVAYSRAELSKFLATLPCVPDVFAYEVPVGLRAIEADINQAVGAFVTLSQIRQIPGWVSVHSASVKRVQGTSKLATAKNGGSVAQKEKKERLKACAVAWANTAICFDTPLLPGDDALADAAAVAVAAWQAQGVTRTLDVKTAKKATPK